jgi:hypothetical protein
MARPGEGPHVLPCRHDPVPDRLQPPQVVEVHEQLSPRLHVSDLLSPGEPDHERLLANGVCGRGRGQGNNNRGRPQRGPHADPTSGSNPDAGND